MEILHFEPEYSTFLAVPYEDFFLLRTFLSSSLEDKRYIKTFTYEEKRILSILFLPLYFLRRKWDGVVGKISHFILLAIDRQRCSIVWPICELSEGRVA